MENSSAPTHESRLHVLDGFRGLLAVFVVWHHLGLTALKAGSMSPILLWPLWVLGGNGGLAVFFFFVLAGFLMTYLYTDVTNLKTYYLKRFSRIFPLFWAGCILFTLQETAKSPPLFYISIGILSLVLIRITWTWFLQNSRRQTILYWGIFGFILLSGLAYRFVMRYPPIILTEIPQSLHTLLVGTVNASLTFGLGDYIPIINFVFWSMGLEILFYLAYPYINLLFFPKGQETEYKGKIIFIIATLACAYYFLLYFICQNLFSLKFFRPETAIYFVIGIFWGLVFKSESLKSIFTKWFSRKWFGAIVALSLAGILYLNAVYLVFGIPGVSELSKALIQTIPVAIFFGYLLLKPTSTIGRFLRSRPLLLLGQLSYSLYLFHAVVVDLIGDAATGQTHFVIIVVRIIFLTVLSVALAWVVYLLSERYYFSTFQKLIKAHADRKIWRPSFKKSILVLFISLQVAICFAFAPSFGLTSITSEIPIKNEITPNERISVQKPLKLLFISTENGLGILYIKMQSVIPINTPEALKQASVLFTLNDLTKNEIVATQKLDGSRIYGGGNFVEVGIPQQADSKNHDYELTVVSENESKHQRLYWLPTKTVRVVSSPPKSEFLKNPAKLANLIGVKFLEFVLQPELLAATAANLLLTNALYFFRFPWRRKV